MIILLEMNEQGHPNCTLCHREKTKAQPYPLQMTEIPDRPFDEIAIDLVTECKTSPQAVDTS